MFNLYDVEAFTVFEAFTIETTCVPFTNSGIRYSTRYWFFQIEMCSKKGSKVASELLL